MKRLSTDMGDFENHVENINKLRPGPSSAQASEDYSQISELNTSLGAAIRAVKECSLDVL